MKIGDVAEKIGMAAKTIRYYEEVGLVRPERSDNGYRNYSADVVHKLAFVGRARSLGFSIQDCRKLLGLYEDKTRASADVRNVAQKHLREIDERLEELHAMRATLSELVKCCEGDDRPDCPILSDLSGNELSKRP